MTVFQTVPPAQPSTAQMFDLAPDENQRLALDMVGRFASRHLTNPDPVTEDLARAFAQLGLDEMIGAFADPVLLGLICERLGAGCALTGLRLILPRLVPGNGQGARPPNLVIARRNGDRDRLVGLAFDPGQPLTVLCDQGPIFRIGAKGLADCRITQLAGTLRGCRVVDGSAPVHQADPGAPEARDVAHRLALILIALLLGGMQRALDFGFDYAHQREAFGKAIIGHQPVAFRLVDGLMKVEALRLLMLNQATLFHRGGGLKGLAEETAAASAAVLRDVMQNCGGHGYVAGTEINTLFQTNSLCRSLLSSLSEAFLSYPDPEACPC